MSQSSIRPRSSSCFEVGSASQQVQQGFSPPAGGAPQLPAVMPPTITWAKELRAPGKGSSEVRPLNRTMESSTLNFFFFCDRALFLLMDEITFRLLKPSLQLSGGFSSKLLESVKPWPRGSNSSETHQLANQRYCSEPHNQSKKTSTFKNVSSTTVFRRRRGSTSVLGLSVSSRLLHPAGSTEFSEGC